MSKLTDITPAHYPESLLPQIEEMAKGAQALLAVAVDENGNVQYVMSGHQQQSILWGLERIKFDLLIEKYQA